MMIGFSPVSTFQARLPAGDDQTFLLNIMVSIRDQLDCITEYNLSSITVRPDEEGIQNLISSFQSSTSDLNNNPIIQLLTSGNQNTVGQVITSVSQEFNKMNSESVDQAASSEYPTQQK